MKKRRILVYLLLLAISTSDAQIYKLFRYRTPSGIKPGVLNSSGKMMDVSLFTKDYDESFFSSDGISRLKQWLVKNESKCKVLPARVDFASPVARPSKIVAIGLNYLEHVREGSGVVPSEPVIFMKSSTSMCGPNDTVLIPKNSLKTDYEVELAIIIGKQASTITEQEASAYIAGYAIINDYSEREWQLERPANQWDKGKSANTFAPIGPYLVTPEEVGDPHNLKIWLTVNGIQRQSSNTGDMIYKVSRLVSDISQYMTLLPGDVIATGTPSGVGLGSKPPKYLRPGDVVELGIEKLGIQRQVIGSALKNYLTPNELKDYWDWVALGPGGLPNTLEGYRTVKTLEKQMKDPLDINRIVSAIDQPGDLKSLIDLPKRKGTKPVIAPYAIPHRQTDQHNDTLIRNLQKKIFDDQVADKNFNLIYKLSYLERHSPGIFIKDSATGNQTVLPVSHAEVGHIHPTDGSMHLILSPSDTKEVIAKGWGELHGLSGQDRIAKTYTMIYSPRDQAELEVTKKILIAAVKYSSQPVKTP